MSKLRVSKVTSTPDLDGRPPDPNLRRQSNVKSGGDPARRFEEALAEATQKERAKRRRR